MVTLLIALPINFILPIGRLTMVMSGCRFTWTRCTQYNSN